MDWNIEEMDHPSLEDMWEKIDDLRQMGRQKMIVMSEDGLRRYQDLTIMWKGMEGEEGKMYALLLMALVLTVLFKILNVNNSPDKSQFYCANQKYLEEFLKKAPELAEPYIPTRFWGFSGHIQTIIQGVISRLHCPLVNGHRVSLKLTDGATVTYDLYHPIEQHPQQGSDFTLAICPGIGNNSESVYIRRVVYNAQLNGYRVCVLNHIGTLPTVPVTSPRIFMYGNTADYAAMIKDLVRRYPNTQIISVGFSMGGNLITKYLGEPRIKPRNVLAGISVCQGYDANRAMQMLLEWKGFRRLYIYAMTENMKSIIRRWHGALFTDEVKRRIGTTERQVLNSGTMAELDDVYTRRLAGFSNLTDFYTAMSCRPHLANIKVPMVFINSLDDPIVPPPLLEIVRNAALTYPNMIYVEQKFGGHLGFYEGGLFYSNPLTWQDRMVIHIAHALVGDNMKSDDEKEDKVVEDNSPSSLKGLKYCDLTPPDSSSEEDFVIWEGNKGPKLRVKMFNREMGTSEDSSEEQNVGLQTPPQTPRYK